jgi:hypothetical protein
MQRDGEGAVDLIEARGALRQEDRLGPAGTDGRLDAFL